MSNRVYTAEVTLRTTVQFTDNGEDVLVDQAHDVAYSEWPHAEEIEIGDIDLKEGDDDPCP